MSDAVLEQMVRSFLATPQSQYSFGWQGGEPTLMGVDFFRRIIEFQKRHGRSGAVVGNGVQTNGTLITPEMARVFAEYQFLVGVSVDGPAEIHDRHRLRANGSGSHEDVMRGIGHLRNAGAEFNILVLVSDANVAHAREVYRYLCHEGFLYHQYIPCVEPGPDRGILPFSISGPQWGDFLCELFDCWYPHDTRRVSVRLFDAILALMVDGVRNICHFGRDCCQYFVVEYNGDIYPCDFFVEQDLRLGNLMQDSWTDLQRSPVYLEFGAQKRRWHPACDDCELLWICQGDCLKHRLCANGGDPRHMSHLCEGWKRFYAHSLPAFERLANQIRRERELAAARTRPGPGAPRPGRNDPCPCGSGKKFKKCCGR
jgi:uncharacterized protein